AYHEATKLSYINLANKPPLYKSYGDLSQVPLPDGLSPPEMPALQAVAGGDSGDGSLVLDTLARILFFSAGLTKKRVLRVAGEVHYRAAASAGALFPVEIYLVCQDIPRLEAGVYHFAPAEFSLRRLRSGDYRSQLLRATADHPDIATAPATLICTAIFWRSAWKYRERGYRYCFWDTGTILANMLAVSSGLDLPAGVVAGFQDSQVDQLLGLDSQREASICLVPLGIGSGSIPAWDTLDLSELPDHGLEISGGRVDYPEMLRTHAASSLVSPEEVAAWRVSRAGEHDLSGEDVEEAPGTPLQGKTQNSQPPSGPLGEVILGRGSTRRFARQSITQSQLNAILVSSTREVQADFRGPRGAGLLDVYVIANAVEGLPSGSYHFSSEAGEMKLLWEGDLREEAGHLCFEQALGADASAVAYFMADLDWVLGRYGNRGYRAAQLEAGIVGGNMYLCAHGLGLGATGMTFYDDEVTEFFSPHAAGKSLMFLVALGVTDRRNRVRPFRSRVGVLLDSLARGARGMPPSANG
ncbi:MAG: hypothetical protein BZY88_02500, partial [SAR202 cluster bacterium Io17-Chloro-G9]